MKRCFIFREGNSQKFWNIEPDGTEFTVTYGKLGTSGQTSSKSFDSEEKCEKEVGKLIAEKTKKGYVESSEEGVKSAKNEGKKYQVKDDCDGDPEELAERILKDKRLPEIKHITIGAWGESFDQDASAIVNMMVENKEKFQHVEYLFFGDMDYEECEISWIQQGDYAALLKALPNLKTFVAKGSQGLSFGDGLVHEGLEEIEVICGGLPKNIVTELKAAKLPNLKKLVLYLGVDEYGLDCTLEDLSGLAQKSLFPKLKELGFVNSAAQNEVVKIILESDILPQLEILDLCCGSLTDVGGQMLLDAQDKLAHLKKLDAHYHFLSADMQKSLRALPFDVDLSDAQEVDDDDDYVFPMYTE
jgi:predicted DNA-binding WGR domain protein